jgi:hypothetical protein
MKRKKMLFICLTAVVLCLGGIALAKAVKAELNPIGIDPGCGFVIFNDTSGPENVQVQMSLKGALPCTEYDVIVHVGGPDTYVATITTNAKGNANFHYSGSADPVPGNWVGLGLKREGAWQFGTGMVDIF